ncbi:MAG: hypothetical protein WKG01_20595 [Kofleriaceae bacterium]
MRVAICLLAACSDLGPAESQLGLNDVSVLVPLPDAGDTRVLRLDDQLVPRTLFDRIVTGPGDIVAPLEQFHLVGIRFELCDRVAPGPCPDDDGRLRLVFQPLTGAPLQAADVALHVSYVIPRDDLAQVVDELRALAALARTPDQPLAISPPLLAGTPGYAARLGALVRTSARASQLVRLTVFAQDAKTAAVIWAFRGVERRGDAFVDLAIPGVDVAQQRAILGGGAVTYNASPVADTPAGFMLALAGDRFAAATAGEQHQALEALAAIQDPAQHGADTVQCVGCHVSTLLTARRAAVAGVDPTTIAGTFDAAVPLSTAGGMATTNERSLRAFGYLGRDAAISQRVVNESAQLLTELSLRFP